MGKKKNKSKKKPVDSLPNKASELFEVVIDSLLECNYDHDVELDLTLDSTVCEPAGDMTRVSLVGAILYSHFGITGKDTAISELCEVENVSENDLEKLDHLEWFSAGDPERGFSGILDGLDGTNIDEGDISGISMSYIEDLQDYDILTAWLVYVRDVCDLFEQIEERRNRAEAEIKMHREVARKPKKSKEEAAVEVQCLIMGLLDLTQYLERIKCCAEFGQETIMPEVNFLATLERCCKPVYDQLTKNKLDKLTIEEKIDKYVDAITDYISAEAAKED